MLHDALIIGGSYAGMAFHVKSQALVFELKPLNFQQPIRAFRIIGAAHFNAIDTQGDHIV